MRYRIAVAVTVVGFSGLVAQMLILRELLVVFSGNEMSIGIILANWLVLEAFGCSVLGRSAEKIKKRLAAFAAISVFFSLSLPAMIYISRVLKNILGISAGESVGLVPILFSSFLVLLPVSTSHGALFTFGCRIYSRSGAGDSSGIGKVYVFETAGTIAGGIAWTYFLIPRFHSFETAALLAVLNFAAAVFLLLPGGRSGKAAVIISCLLLFLGVYSLFSGKTEEIHKISIEKGWEKQNVVHYENSVYGNITVIESAGHYTFFRDGIPSIAVPVPDIASAEEFAHIPLLSHPRPGRVLVLGGGAGGVINEILKHPSVQKVEYTEIDPLVPELLRKYSTSLTERELTDERVRVRHVDGRLFLNRDRDEYDVIFVGLQGPSDLQSNRFFTEEFFRLAGGRLAEKGMLVIRLPGSLVYINEELRDLNACVLNTLERVFEHVRPVPGDGRNLFLASDSEEIVRLDTSRVIERLGERELEAEQIVPWHIENKLHPRWEDWFNNLVAGSTREINRDFSPRGVFYSIAHWSSVYTPYLRGFFGLIERLNLRVFVGAFLLFAAVVLPVGRRRRISRGGGIAAGVATTGFAGMVFDLALIFAFQSVYGYVFSWIGLLVTSFMAGAACAAAAMNSLSEKIKDRLKCFLWTEIAVAVFAALLSLVFFAAGPFLDSPAAFRYSRFIFLLILFISGGMVGLQFPLANRMRLERGSSLSATAGFLYGSDLMGGWLGGIAGGVILLPVLGLYGACAVVVLLKLGSFIIIVTGKE